jgi:hypothetical protein
MHGDDKEKQVTNNVIANGSDLLDYNVTREI